ncbi:MAG: ammonia channel protein, partial [Cytophagaceae bacterium]|nr:ammonia channel protein [Gemmatimonadaceae bacterium]
VIVALAAGASYAAIQWRARTRIDDALDVFACHGVAGILGAMLTGVFATKRVNPAGADGWLAGNPAQLWIQLLAVGATISLSGGVTAVIVVAMRAVMPVRLPIDQEIRGVDLVEHGEEAYHGGDIGELAGRHASLGDSVLLPASDLAPAPSHPQANAA